VRVGVKGRGISIELHHPWVGELPWVHPGILGLGQDWVGTGWLEHGLGLSAGQPSLNTHATPNMCNVLKKLLFL
jgi:hypothetical protein